MNSRNLQITHEKPRKSTVAELPLTFEMLFDLEPGLLELHDLAKSIRDDKRRKSFCANRVWYGPTSQLGLKISDLVGRNRPDRHPVLGSSVAYTLAYHIIYDALPRCRNCACVFGQGFLFGADE